MPDPTVPLEEAPHPPPHLDAEAAEEWERVAAAAVALGSLRVCDLPALALLAETLALARAAQRTLTAEGFLIATAAGNPKGHPAARVLVEARQHATQMLDRFGLTPIARKSVESWPSPLDQEWDLMGSLMRPFGCRP
jgi:P27 family predicted phage terminase small subunit